MRAIGVSLLTALVVALFAAPPAFAQDLDEQLDRADELRQEGAFEEGRAFLEDLREQHPENAEVLWRLARIMTDAGGELEEGSDAQRELYLEAVPVAEAAIEADPENSWAHLSLAIAAGQAGLVSGTRQQIELSRRVKEHADKAIELDDQNDLAYHVRGRWNHEVASLGWVSRAVVRTVYGGLPDASFEAAEADLRKALETRERIIHRLELGRTLTELGREDEAREQFRAAIQMPEEDPNDFNYKQEAHQLLTRL